MSTLEKFEDELAHGLVFVLRMLRFFCYATALLLLGLIPSVLGFYFIEDKPFLQSLLNAISIIGSVSLPYSPQSEVGLLFIAIYSLLIDTLFLVAVGLLVTPVIHRILHKWHLEKEE